MQTKGPYKRIRAGQIGLRAFSRAAASSISVVLVRGAEPRIAGIVVTRYDSRNSLEPELLDQIAEIAKQHDAPLLGCVRNTVNARKAQFNGMALVEFAPNSTAALDYEEAVSAYLAGLGIEDDDSDE